MLGGGSGSVSLGSGGVAVEELLDEGGGNRRRSTSSGGLSLLRGGLIPRDGPSRSDSE